jgi:superfamily I DNA/RNA helicase
VEYALGRFLPEDIREYISTDRTGRGNSPRMDGGKREQLIEEVLLPYAQWKSDNGLVDWNDLAVQVATKSFDERFDIIIVDETQDFSANQIRAINNALTVEHSLTFVLDTAQRIYARGFTWKEAGITVQPENSYKLSVNFRNTKQIAQLAAPLLNGLAIGDDGSIPNFDTCQRDGEMPNVLVGYFNQQVSYAIDYIKNNIDLKNETVGMLHMGGSLKFITEAFDKAGLEYVKITRESEWPDGDENIAFSTLHSAKGLEFDHVFILGLSEFLTTHGDDEDDDRLISLRRLLAMGIGRARETVTIGYKPGEESILLKYLDSITYQEVIL